MRRLTTIFLSLALGLGATACSQKSQSIPVTLKDHRFTPAEIHVPANKPFVIELKNEDDAAEEFDSSSLKVEKVFTPNSSGIIRIRPLSPGRYPFMGEYHAETAQGVVIAE